MTERAKTAKLFKHGRSLAVRLPKLRRTEQLVRYSFAARTNAASSRLKRVGSSKNGEWPTAS